MVWSKKYFCKKVSTEMFEKPDGTLICLLGMEEESNNLEDDTDTLAKKKSKQ